jgi:hypothetical protein
MQKVAIYTRVSTEEGFDICAYEGVWGLKKQETKSKLKRKRK